MQQMIAVALVCALAPASAMAQGADETEKVAGFETLDTNGDGVIDDAEWAAGSHQLAKAPGFGALDADGDGRISPKEWRLWAEAGGSTPEDHGGSN